MNTHDYDLLVLGGGAAGFFAALAAKAAHPHAKVAILEKYAVVLAKVRVSGGGRCNVTHACFDPLSMSKHYPRGEKELIGPFHRFQPEQTVAWFQSRGVALKKEADGRMFPTTDDSNTIITCLLSEAEKLGVEILLRYRVESLEKKEGGFVLHGRDGADLTCKKLILATGSSADGHAWAQAFGHTIHPPVPSLFTFNIPNSSLAEMSGVSFEKVGVHIKGTPYSFEGPFLVTHFGFSGPAVLKLSAWAARVLHEKNYDFEAAIHWIPDHDREQISRKLRDLKQKAPTKTLVSENPFHMPKRFWKYFLSILGEAYAGRLADLSFKQIDLLVEKLVADSYHVKGKTTHKEEFVTCGGVSLKEINFKTMESKICPGLFFAGEILDIDGITGGFNFQNAWTTGYIAGSS